MNSLETNNALRKKISILIVDDQPVNIQALSGILQEEHTIMVATSGAKALEIARGEKKPNLILLDIKMPEMDGYEVLRRLKADENTRDIPVIFVTVKNAEGEEEFGLELGAVDYICKPYIPGVVKVRVKQLLDRMRFNVLFRTLYESGSDAIMLLDDTGYLDCNPAALTFFGVKSVEAFCALHPADLSPSQQEDGRDSMTADTGNMETAMREGSNRFEWLHKRHDTGEVFPADVFLTRMELDGKQVLQASVRDISERKQAEAALKKSEEKYRAVFDNAIEGILIVKAGRIALANLALEKMTGYKQEILMAKPFTEFIHPDDRKMVFERDKKRIAGEDVETAYDFRVIRLSEEKRWVHILSSTIEWEGEPSTLNFLTDITEQKQAEKALIKSEKKWQNVLLNTPQIGIALDPKAKITFANARFLKLTGWEAQEIIGQDWFDLFIPENIRKEVRNIFNSVMSQKDTVDLSIYENDILTKGGELRQVSWSNVLTKDNKGDIVDLTCLGIDLTERIRAEQKIKKSEAKYRLLVENQTDLVVKIDLEGRFLFVSPSYCRMFDKKHDELLGKKFMPLVHKEDQESTAKAMDALFSPPHTAYIEQRAMTKDGWRWLSWSDTAEVDSDGNVVEIIGVGRDVTDRKEAEKEKKKLQAQLNQAQKMESVGRLAGGVAHDFNNMLGVIIGHTELALLQADENHDLHDDLKEIQKAAQRSADITKQLLAFARKQTISPRQMDVNETVENMLNMLRRLIGEDIDLVWQPGAHLWPVKMDPTQIDQILANLCVNARDAIPVVGKLTIETGRKTFDEQYCSEHPGFVPGDFVLLAVSDNGCGMDSDTLENLFEPFFTTKDVGKGTGMGLATVYGIVKQNHGFINVYSEPGQGSTFRIYLPRLIAETDIAEVVPDQQEAVRGTETILLVEDEPSILRMARMMLERNGYTVLTAATPAEAMEKAKSHSSAIDLLMTDVVMPEMNGRDIAEKITALYPDIRLLFMSGYTANVIAHQGVLDKGVAFIQKPFSMGDLTEKLREVLDMASYKS